MKQLGMAFLEEPQARALVDAETFHVAAIRETSASFAERAHAWVLKHLKGHGPTSGEDPDGRHARRRHSPAAR
jgi:hypothetical protein